MTQVLPTWPVHAPPHVTEVAAPRAALRVTVAPLEKKAVQVPARFAAQPLIVPELSDTVPTPVTVTLTEMPKSAVTLVGRPGMVKVQEPLPLQAPDQLEKA